MAAEPTPSAPELSPPDRPSFAEEEPTPEAPLSYEEHQGSQESEMGPEAVASVVVKEEVVAEEAVVVLNMADRVPKVQTQEEVADVAERAAGEKDPLPEAVEPVEDLEEDRQDNGGGEEEDKDAEEQDSEGEVEEETGKGAVEDTERSGADYAGVEGTDQQSDNDGSESDDDADNEGNEEDHLSVYVQDPLTERKRHKGYEIYIGGLHKEAVDNDLIEVFGVCGVIQSVKIVKHPTTQKSKGFAFIRYKTIESAQKAIADFKDGTEVRGKKVRISATQNNDTLYLGNICKTWTRNQVIETLKGYGVELVENILLLDDPKKEGHTKGYAFLEFSSHDDAMSAFQRLRKPDAVFGCDRSAKVAFAQTPMDPSEETMLQVKTVCVEGIPLSWDEERIKEFCKRFGEIENVRLSRGFTTKKRKVFGLVAFTSRENAVSCVEGINNTQIGEGKVKVKATLSKPQYRGRLARQGARGGFKVWKNGEDEKDADLTKKNHVESKEVHGKGKSDRMLKNGKGNKPPKIPNKVTEEKTGVPSHSKAGQPSKGKKRGRRGIGTTANEQQSKKARNIHNSGNLNVRPSRGYGKRKNTHIGKQEVRYATPVAYPTRNVQPATSYGTYSYCGDSGSERHHADLEPHAGYLPPAQQVQNPFGYEHRRFGGYGSQLRIGSAYEGAIAVPQTSYPGHASYAGYEDGNAYRSSGVYPPHGPHY